MKDFAALKQNLKKDFSTLKTIRIALLGDSATQLLKIALQGSGYENGIHLEIYEANFDQIEIQVFDPASPLHQFRPEIVIIFRSSQKLLEKYNRSPEKQLNQFSKKVIKEIESIHSCIVSGIKARVIQYNFPEIDDAVFGNYSNITTSSFLFQNRKLNLDLMNMASKKTNVFLCDISSVQNQLGKKSFFQPSLYITNEMVFSIEALPVIASRTLDIINSLNGKIKKCIILDLDNTLWGGIIGDEGIENIQLGGLGIGKAFSDFQYWIKKLKNRGIILAVCSKNYEKTAKEPFEKHPDMILKLSDISVFIANWESKTTNIRLIQSILNIGFDSMVFIDDSPAERNLVRQSLPEICVPELPEDPADYLEYLYALNLFETTSFSKTDEQRTQLYQTEAERVALKNQYNHEGDYLQSLSMKSLVEPFNKFNIPRAVQLIKRSNQFNLRTIRYTEAEIELLQMDHSIFTFTFTLEDKFGDHGLISVVILKKTGSDSLFIDTWLMSCRVFNRGMEEFVLNTIAFHAISNGFLKLKGEYIATPKNEIVKDLYSILGFEKEHGIWVLNLTTFRSHKNFITNKN